MTEHEAIIQARKAGRVQARREEAWQANTVGRSEMEGCLMRRTHMGQSRFRSVCSCQGPATSHIGLEQEPGV